MTGNQINSCAKAVMLVSDFVDLTLFDMSVCYLAVFGSRSTFQHYVQVLNFFFSKFSKYFPAFTNVSFKNKKCFSLLSKLRKK